MIFSQGMEIFGKFWNSITMYQFSVPVFHFTLKTKDLMSIKCKYILKIIDLKYALQYLFHMYLKKYNQQKWTRISQWNSDWKGLTLYK